MLLFVSKLSWPFKAWLIFSPLQDCDIVFPQSEPWCILTDPILQRERTQQKSSYTKQLALHLMQGWNRTSNSYISTSDDSFRLTDLAALSDHIQYARSMPIRCTVTHMWMKQGKKKKKKRMVALAHKEFSTSEVRCELNWGVYIMGITW